MADKHPILMDDRPTQALFLYDSDIMLIILEEITGKGPHPARAEGHDAADILHALDLDDDDIVMLKNAAKRIMDYFAKAAHEAGLSPDDKATRVGQEGRA